MAPRGGFDVLADVVHGDHKAVERRCNLPQSRRDALHLGVGVLIRHRESGCYRIHHHEAERDTVLGPEALGDPVEPADNLIAFVGVQEVRHTARPGQRQVAGEGRASRFQCSRS
jgi:hypothetical protein